MARLELVDESAFIELSKTSGVLFRGHRDASWKLLASIYRNTIDGNVLKELEPLCCPEGHWYKTWVDHFLLTNFKYILQSDADYRKWSESISGRDLDLSLWAHLQHYGFGTMYLDFTTSFIVACFFSLFPLKQIIEGDINIENISSCRICTIKPASIFVLAAIDLMNYPVDKKPYSINPLSLNIDNVHQKNLNPRIYSQCGFLLCSKDAYFLENSCLYEHIQSYHFSPSVAFTYFINVIKNQAEERKKIEDIIAYFKDDKPPQFKITVELHEFISDFKNAIGEATHKVVPLTVAALEGVFAKVTRVPTPSKPGFDRNNFIAVGH